MEHEQKNIIKLFVENRNMLFMYILGLVRDRHDAEELLQDVAVVILEKADAGIEIRSFTAYAREVARRTVLDFWKKHKRTSLMLSEDILDIIDKAYLETLDKNTDLRESIIFKLRSCMNRLADKIRSLIEMRYKEGMDFTEIAEQAGKTSDAVQMALSRARMKLLECITKD